MAIDGDARDPLRENFLYGFKCGASVPQAGVSAGLCLERPVARRAKTLPARRSTWLTRQAGT
jgi:hypothetical protein